MSMADDFGVFKSSVKEAAAAVKSAPGYLKRIIVQGGATSDTLTIYDNTAGSGTVLFKTKIQEVASTTIPRPIDIDVPFATGCYVDFTGGANQIDFINVIYS
ncbi:MAG: hypothetical protein AMJ65_16435 [Phycisphaerae bacterium SG8_4]|nr:MAG: hypothetical protein AMJ65_16435 [Phycisphaerae bacterium SG8_4]